jgi:hypothetical protein
MHRYPRPKSSIPKRHGDSVRFRGRQAQEPNRTFTGHTGHHIDQTIKTFRRMMFKLIPYEEA